MHLKSTKGEATTTQGHSKHPYKGLPWIIGNSKNPNVSHKLTVKNIVKTAVADLLRKESLLKAKVFA